jgi:hypothetical protein
MRHELQVYSANLSIVELEQICEWMTEDPQRLRQRKELLCEQKKLFVAQELVERVLGRGDDSHRKPDDLGSAMLPPPTTPTRNFARNISIASGKRRVDIDDRDEVPGLGNPLPSPTKKLRRDLARTKLSHSPSQMTSDRS